MSLRKLLTVERVFASGDRILVVPSLPWRNGRPVSDDAAEVRRPDGSVVRVRLQLCPTHVNRTRESVEAGDSAWVRTCDLTGIAASDVPAGSELWCREELVDDALGAAIQVRDLVAYVDVDDTLVRTASGKRIPMPAAIAHVKELHAAGVTLYCWSAGGAEYARATAGELGIENVFTAFLPKPHVLIDDAPPAEWPRCVVVRPGGLASATVHDHLAALAAPRAHGPQRTKEP